MNFDFDDDQKAMASTLRRYLEANASSKALRAAIDAGPSYDAALWRGLGELGVLGAAIPEAYGGAGFGYLELCLVAEECGRALAPVPTVPSIYLAAEVLLAAGSEAQKQAWLPKIAAGEAVGTLALSEQPGELTPGGIAAQVANGLLTGAKIPVCDGMDAHFAIAAAREADALSLYLVKLEQPGITRAPVKTLDPSRKHARVEFSGVRAERIGEAGQGWAILTAARDRAAVLTAFEQLGGAERALEMGTAYAKERYAFGRPIGSFQAIKHMLADMYVSTALARSNALYAAWALSANAPELGVAAAGARVAATKAFQLCSTNNTQVHGGMGFTWEFDCHLYYRRSNYLALALGGPSYWEDRLIGQMLAGADA
jgi:alkylation response protein AidB-like acyl-CoA dehydrogenase